MPNNSIRSLNIKISYTLNKGILPNPPKMIPEVCTIETPGFQIYETFKGSFLGHMGGTFGCETCFKFRGAKKVS